MRLLRFAFVLLFACSCSSSAEQLIAVELKLRGTKSQAVDLNGGGTIEFTAAELAFGPLYLCAGTQAGELCESARLEWVDSALVDVLDETPRLVGSLEGRSGTVRSWMYDHAFTSTRSSARPIELSAAAELDHNSVRLSGVVEEGSLIIPFHAEFTIVLSDEVEPGFPVVRSSTPVNLEFRSESQSLEVQFQTKSWLSVLRLSDFYQELDCDDEIKLTCQGQMQVTCDEDGTLLDEVDCGERDEVCVPFVGCRDAVELTAESRAVRALKQEIIAGTRPVLRLD